MENIEKKRTIICTISQLSSIYNNLQVKTGKKTVSKVIYKTTHSPVTFSSHSPDMVVRW